MSTVNLLRKSIVSFVKDILVLNQNTADFFALSECGRYPSLIHISLITLKIGLKLFKCQTTDIQDNAIICLGLILMLARPSGLRTNAICCIGMVRGMYGCGDVLFVNAFR